MTGVRNSSYQHSEVTNTHGRERMKFWGVCCVGGKAYKQVVNYRFHLTMAVLDPKSYDRDVRDKTVSLSVIQHGQVFLLCVLKHGEIQQVNLNLIFDKGDDVTFSVGGNGTVHLTGYQLIDSSDSAFDADNEHYCPVAELGSEKQIHKRLSPPVNGVENKSKLKKALMGEAEGEDDSDEDDSDFYIKPEEIEEEESDEDDSDEEEEFEIDEEEVQAVLQDMDEIETPPRTEGSLKRKVEKMSLPQKRVKKEKFDSESEGKKEEMSLSQKRVKKEKFDSESEEKNEEMSLEDNESNSEEDGLNSSIGHTPMPKKPDDSTKAKKKLKKRKRLSEISNLDKSVQADDVLPQNKITNNKAKQPVMKLNNGLEFQDVVIGRGPLAEKGKVVSVFYVGRLEDKSIFDARTPPKKPFSFKMGVPEVIKGLDIGIKGMRVGGQRKLKIPPNMGYGSKGINSVPSNSTLFFTIELISVN